MDPAVKYALGVDVGGTKILGAVVDDRGQIVRAVKRPTDKDAVTETVVGVIEETLSGGPESVRAIGLALAGFVEAKSGTIAFAPNLRDVDPDIRNAVAGRFDVPVIIENDANAAAWAESQFGAARGATNMIMLTVGTGIGGGAVLGGKLYRGSRGFAGEFGHMVAVVDGDLCGCGRRGCLEAMASGTALGKLAREKLPRHPESDLFRRAGGDSSKVTGAMVGESAVAGDDFALELFAEIGMYLGLGLAGLAQAFDPDLIVIGGGVARQGDALLKPAAEHLALRFEDQIGPPQVVQAKLGNDAGVIGVASLALDGRLEHK